MFERLIEWVRTYDPQFSAVGAPPAQIAELESLIGKVPEVYRDFLAVMGRNMDWIAIGHMDLSIEAVLEYYRRERWLPPDLYIRIGFEEGDPRLHPYLETMRDSEEPPVIAFPSCKPETLFDTVSRSSVPLAGSLPELIADPVFRMYELRRGSRRPARAQTETWRDEAIDEAEGLIEYARFTKLWFSNTTGRAYTRPDGAIRSVQHPGHPLQIMVSCDSPKDQQEIVDDLATNIEGLARV